MKYNNILRPIIATTLAMAMFFGGGVAERVSGSAVITPEKSLTAQWAPNAVKITFDSNGGGVAPGDQVYTYGIERSLPGVGNMIKAGYHVIGWAESSTATTPKWPLGAISDTAFGYADETQAIAKTLWAVWEEDEDLAGEIDLLRTNLGEIAANVNTINTTIDTVNTNVNSVKNTVNSAGTSGGLKLVKIIEGSTSSNEFQTIGTVTSEYGGILYVASDAYYGGDNGWHSYNFIGNVKIGGTQITITPYLNGLSGMTYNSSYSRNVISAVIPVGENKTVAVKGNGSGSGYSYTMYYALYQYAQI